MFKTLIYVDPLQPRYSLGLLEAARQIAPEGGETYAVTLNGTEDCVQGDFDFWIPIRCEAVAAFDTANIARCLVAMQEEHGFDCILIPATVYGRMVAPRVAMRLNAGLVADVTAIQNENGKVRLVRPAFDGKIMAAIECTNPKPMMASIRPGVFSYTKEAQKDTRQLSFALPSLVNSGVTLLSSREKEVSQDIRDSKLLVSGGGGVENSLAELAPLAEALGGMVSVSRRLVDNGLASRSIQVGQSGKTVSPRVYLALGIYGSLQHIEGLQNVEHIISINTNRHVPICSLSDIVVEGDAIEVVHKLLERIHKDD